MVPDCKVEPKNTFFFDIREYPELKKEWEQWFSEKVITKGGFTSAWWRNRQNFGNASTQIFKILVHNDLMDAFVNERANIEELGQENTISVVWMPKSIGDAKEKILKCTPLYNKCLDFASRVQKIIEDKKPKPRQQEKHLKPLKSLF